MTATTLQPDASGGLTGAANRYAGPVKWIAAAVIVVALFLLVRMLPVDQGVQLLKAKVDGLGLLGPVVFILAYIIAALLFVPGAALTLAAGAVFGLLQGTIVVSIASTTAAAFGFLIARYLARDRVAAVARRRPRFRAIDEAIREGDWRIVGMLRLSPALPYSLSNYLYGLTPVRFWPYVFASWAAMLPGTFMYVYIGHIGAASLSAASEGAASADMGRWALLVLGFAATVAVTVYITKLARRALDRYTHVEEAAEETPAAGAAPAARGWPWGATVAALVAVLLGGAAAFAYTNPALVKSIFGPPRVELEEAYAAEAGGQTMDHAPFTALLAKYVDDHGWVDYAGFKADEPKLDAYLDTLAAAPFDALSRDAKLAYLIDAYNAYTLKLILEYFPVGSIKDIPANRRWDDVRWPVAGHTLSLNQIEHEWIRAKFAEPRIHFAINCASVGCPPLRNEAYEADRLDAQLDDQMRFTHAESPDRWIRVDAANGVVHLTRLYDWYGSDFVQAAGSVLGFARRYSPALDQLLQSNSSPTIRWLEYDWSLNSQDNPAAQGS